MKHSEQKAGKINMNLGEPRHIQMFKYNGGIRDIKI
jgi:hypothetical protein